MGRAQDATGQGLYETPPPMSGVIRHHRMPGGAANTRQYSESSWLVGKHRRFPGHQDHFPRTRVGDGSYELANRAPISNAFRQSTGKISARLLAFASTSNIAALTVE